MKLILYDKACAALAAAKSVDEAKKIHDTAEGMRAYARQAKNKALQVDAAEISIRAERRLGELMAQQRDAGLLAKGGQPQQKTSTGSRKDPVGAISLTELGIDKRLADRARKFAAVPERSFESQIGEWRARVQQETERVTTNLVREGERRSTEPPKLVTPGFPDGPFRAIAIDPPWPMEKIAFERRPTEKLSMDYATMSLEEIANLPVQRLANQEGTHVYLWVTHHFLPEGLRLFEKWGVRYECMLTWIKPTAQPLWWRFLTEHILFGKIGSLAPLKKGEAVCFSAPQQRHSHKPDEFFDLVRRVSPEPRLTMFDSAREGFTAWGSVHA